MCRMPSPEVGYRNPFCPFYETCLDGAAVNPKTYNKGFSCSKCEHIDDYVRPIPILLMRDGATYYELDSYASKVLQGMDMGIIGE